MYKSSTDYPHCLRHALYNILQQNLDNPVLILEDDIVFHKNPRLVFDVPVNADALYIGVAGTCMDFEESGRNRLVKIKDYEIIDNTFIRIKNMLCAHGILYLGREYKETLSKCTLNSDMLCDVDMCKLQRKYTIYGLRFPICWQSLKYNPTDWNENITKVRFNERGCWEWQEAIEDD
jgi:GR25 family glycosyltransferase involved in LPS biosynthesis